MSTRLFKLYEFIDFVGDQVTKNNTQMYYAYKGTVDSSIKIKNGLSNDIPKGYNNAHPAFKMCIDGSMTIFEYGVTRPFSTVFGAGYDYYSGEIFSTFPTSAAGLLGSTNSKGSDE